MKEILKGRKGITLIALVITIIVLLILAGVSIAMLTGENGILKQASNAQIKTKQAEVEEMVSLAIESLQIKNLGDTSKITPQMIAEQVNQENDRSDVSAEKSSFPTNILFEKDGLQVPVDISLKVGDSSTIGPDTGPIYSVDINESDISQDDLFVPYEISSTASSNKVAIIGDLSTVPTKEIGVRLNAEYCNTEGYNPETDEFDPDKNTFYEINYKGTIMDKLVIPYQIEYKGELCKVAEVDLTVGFEKSYLQFGIPRVKEIIIPNTVKKLKAQNRMSSFNDSSIPNEKLENIVFSNKLKEIPEELFRGCTNIRTVTIPSSVEKIGDGTYSDLFWDCPNLETINIMKEEGSIPGYETKWGAEEDVVINWLGEE